MSINLSIAQDKTDVSVSVEESVDTINLSLVGSQNYGVNVSVQESDGNSVAFTIDETIYTTVSTVVSDLQNNVVNVAILEPEIINLSIYPLGIKGDSWQQSFETVNSNLQGYDFAINRTDGEITSVVYTTESGTITKTLNRTDGVVTSIVLSGDTPNGIDLTKTLNRTNGNITSVEYS